MHDFENRRYFDKRKIVLLTKRENIILALLIENKMNITSCKEISIAIYNQKLQGRNYKNIVSIVSRLRQKLKGLLNIYNKYKEGYCLYEHW